MEAKIGCADIINLLFKGCVVDAQGILLILWCAMVKSLYYIIDK